MLTQDEQSVADVLEIQDLLDVLGDLYAQRDAMTAPLLAQIADLQAQVASLTEEIDAQITPLQNAVKKAVGTHGATVETARIRATYVKPRVSWDTKRLEGYAEAHPEIRKFRREGAPSVRIAVVK
jgi:hypothetical protein